MFRSPMYDTGHNFDALMLPTCVEPCDSCGLHKHDDFACSTALLEGGCRLEWMHASVPHVWVCPDSQRHSKELAHVAMHEH